MITDDVGKLRSVRKCEVRCEGEALHVILYTYTYKTVARIHVSVIIPLLFDCRLATQTPP